MQRCLIASLVFTAAVAQSGRDSFALPLSDGSIFFDHFTGPAGNLTVGPNYAQVVGTFVQDGATLATVNGSGTHFVRSVGLDFAASPNEWVASVRFRVNGTLNTETTRQLHLLGGTSSPSPLGTDDWAAIGFDLRAVEVPGDTSGTGSTFNLLWYGWDNVDTNRVGTAISGGSGLEKNTFYTVTMHRKPDNMIDLWLDENLIDTKPIIPGLGAGNVGKLNPDRLNFGSISGLITANVSWDFVSVGMIPPPPIIPEPASSLLATLGAAILALMRPRRRLRAS